MKTRIRGGRELNSFVVPRITETRRKLQCNVMCMLAAPRDKDCRFRGTDGVQQRRLYSNCRDARDGRTNEALAHPAPASVGGSSPEAHGLIMPNLVPPLWSRHVAKVVGFLPLPSMWAWRLLTPNTSISLFYFTLLGP